MTGYVVEIERGKYRDQSGTVRARIWWWFFTDPLEFSVWWMPDGSRSMEQFAEEQAAKVRAFLEW
jgi:hypothetical protein